MDKYSSPAFLDAVAALKKYDVNCVASAGSLSLCVQKEKFRLDDRCLEFESLNIVVLNLPKSSPKKDRLAEIYGKIHPHLSKNYIILKSQIDDEIKYNLFPRVNGSGKSHFLQIGYGYVDRHGIPIEFHRKSKNIDEFLDNWKKSRFVAR